MKVTHVDRAGDIPAPPEKTLDLPASPRKYDEIKAHVSYDTIIPMSRFNITCGG